MNLECLKLVMAIVIKQNIREINLEMRKSSSIDCQINLYYFQVPMVIQYMFVVTFLAEHLFSTNRTQID